MRWQRRTPGWEEYGRSVTNMETANNRPQRDSSLRWWEEKANCYNNYQSWWEGRKETDYTQRGGGGVDEGGGLPLSRLSLTLAHSPHTLHLVPSLLSSGVPIYIQFFPPGFSRSAVIEDNLNMLLTDSYLPLSSSLSADPKMCTATPVHTHTHARSYSPL